MEIFQSLKAKNFFVPLPLRGPDSLLRYTLKNNPGIIIVLKDSYFLKLKVNSSGNISENNEIFNYGDKNLKQIIDEFENNETCLGYIPLTNNAFKTLIEKYSGKENVKMYPMNTNNGKKTYYVKINSERNYNPFKN